MAPAGDVDDAVLVPGARILGIRRLIGRKWERWFVANWISYPPSVAEY